MIFNQRDYTPDGLGEPEICTMSAIYEIIILNIVVCGVVDDF